MVYSHMCKNTCIQVERCTVAQAYIVPGLGKPEQENYEFKASLGLRPCLRNVGCHQAVLLVDGSPGKSLCFKVPGQ